MSLTPGTNLDGYDVLDSFGAGGVGEVYCARDSVMKCEVSDQGPAARTDYVRIPGKLMR
jgi:hypothetical protein